MTLAPDRLRVATLNLWGYFGDWPARLEALSRCFSQRVGADVLLCQEVCLGEGFDQARQTAQALGFPYYATVMAAEPDAGVQEGVAIFSRRALRAVSARRLPASTPERVLLSATVAHGDGELGLAAAHAVFSPERVRYAQTRTLMAMLRDGALVLGADLNSTPSQLAAGAVDLHGLRDVFAGCETPTWPNDPAALRRAWCERLGSEPAFDLRPRRLDYLLARDVAVTGRGSDPLREGSVYASDHAVLWVDVEARAGFRA